MNEPIKVVEHTVTAAELDARCSKRKSTSMDTCDFCTDPRPTWAYPAKPFGLSWSTDGKETPMIKMTGSWSSCEACAVYVEAGDYDTLAQRASSTLIRLRPDVVEADLLPRLRAAYAIFHEQRDGARFRLG